MLALLTVGQMLLKMPTTISHKFEEKKIMRKSIILNKNIIKENFLPTTFCSNATERRQWLCRKSQIKLFMIIAKNHECDASLC